MPSLEEIQPIVIGAMEQMNATLENSLRPIRDEMAAYRGRSAALAAAAAPYAARFEDAVAAVGGNNRPRFQPNSLPKFRFGEAVDIGSTWSAMKLRFMEKKLCAHTSWAIASCREM
jgi:hypothetical protein